MRTNEGAVIDLVLKIPLLQLNMLSRDNITSESLEKLISNNLSDILR